MLISLVVLVGLTIWTWPDNKVRVIFCDVGQGDGVLIIQGRSEMLIDTGPENKKMVGCLGRYLPFWDKQIEAVVLTHWDVDHSGGLKEIGQYYKVDKLYSSAAPGEILRRGDVLKFGSIRFEVLSPDRDWGNTNDNSVVGVLSYESKRILLTGDASKEVERELVWRKYLQEKIDILKVAHHGSESGTSEELLNLVHPDEAVISVGKKNRFGHPTKTVLERLEKFGVKTRRTDIEGDIIYTW